jgi:hypothetical protein
MSAADFWAISIDVGVIISSRISLRVWTPLASAVQALSEIDTHISR